jgi:hypothetical protein
VEFERPIQAGSFRVVGAVPFDGEGGQFPDGVGVPGPAGGVEPPGFSRGLVITCFLILLCADVLYRVVPAWLPSQCWTAAAVKAGRRPPAGLGLDGGEDQRIMAVAGTIMMARPGRVASCARIRRAGCRLSGGRAAGY